MGAWLLSIAGVIVVGVVVELLLTDSPMSKFVRSMYAFFVLLVIVAPLPGFFRGGIEIGGEIDYNWDLIAVINANSATAATGRVNTALAQNGFGDAVVTIQYKRDSPNFVIERVYINALDVSNGSSINVRSRIINIVTAVLNIDEGRIEYHAETE